MMAPAGERLWRYAMEKAAEAGIEVLPEDSLRSLLAKLAMPRKKKDTPLSPLAPVAPATKPNRRQQDIDLWHVWNQGGRQPEHLEPLIDRFEPTIEAKVRQWKPPMAQEEAFRTELRKHVVKAIHSYDPNRGTAVSTHVVSRLPAAIRWGSQHANLAYIPEAKAKNIGPLLAAQDELREQFGRDPTHDELAEHTGISLKHVKKTMGALRKDVLSSSFESDPNPQANQRHMEIIEMLPPVLPDDNHRKVFNYMYGLNGHPKIESPGEIARKMGKNPSQISRMRTKILDIYKSNL